MASSVRCPRVDMLVPTESCLVCEYIRKDDDVSNIWCRYLIGKHKEAPPELNDLLFQLEQKEKQMARAYKMGRTRLGDNIGWEIRELNNKIKKMKEEK